MTAFKRFARFIVLGCASLATTALAAPDTTRHASSLQWVLPPTATVANTGFPEWTARWWSWALSQRVEPYLDPDGRLCEYGQDGPVWFLAGTNGRFSATRQCAVPEDKYILLPIINMVEWSRKSNPSKKDCAAMQAAMAVNNDGLVSAVVLIDGVAVPDVAHLRVRGDRCFPIAKRSSAAAVDGYWLMLKPLPRGRHTITVGANYNPCRCDRYSAMVQNFEYIVDIGGRVNSTMIRRLKRASVAVASLAGPGRQTSASSTTLAVD